MAQLIKSEYNLVALKITLEARHEPPRVRFELEVTEEHEPRTVWPAEVEASAIGLPMRFDPSRLSGGIHEFQLPQGFAEALKNEVDNLGYHGPLWLHLVKPYGMLGAFPWERRLASLDNPLLRIPDALADPPTELPHDLEVVLCASRPLAKESFQVPYALSQMAQRIVAAVAERQVRVHVFADLECRQELRSTLRAANLLDQSVFVYDPKDALEYGIPRRTSEVRAAQRVTSPWLLWMQDALAGRSVDVVHFLCHGYMADCGGALAFAESPAQNNDPQWSRFVEASELGLFLLKMGAWSVAFSSPEGNYSEIGLRYLTDQFAQVRPGPVFFHDTAGDSGFQELAATYRFLYCHQQFPPPHSPSVALCCQPFLVAREKAASRDVPSLAALASRGTEPVPAWFASAHRFVEQKQFEIRQTKNRRPGSSASASEDLDGMERGVDEIKATLDRLARKGVL